MGPYPTTAYEPRHATFPYSDADFARLDPAADAQFYAPPRFVTHIDDAAIAALKTYYAAHLPASGRILDLCSSWISHLPAELEARAIATATATAAAAAAAAAAAGAGAARGGDRNGPAAPATASLTVIGIGMNRAELDANPVLRRRVVKDLNADPVVTRQDVGDADDGGLGRGSVHRTDGAAGTATAATAATAPTAPTAPTDVSTNATSATTPTTAAPNPLSPSSSSSSSSSQSSPQSPPPPLLDAATCVVSIDYLTKPLAVLRSVRALLRPRAPLHLVLSNRCFPSKAVARWLRVDEPARAAMVADYLWFSGFREIETLTLVAPRGPSDPLWVVRGVNPG